MTSASSNTVLKDFVERTFEYRMLAYGKALVSLLQACSVVPSNSDLIVAAPWRFVSLEFVLRNSGELLKVSIAKSSESLLIDDACLLHLQDTLSRAPQLPRGAPAKLVLTAHYSGLIPSGVLLPSGYWIERSKYIRQAMSQLELNIYSGSITPSLFEGRALSLGLVIDRSGYLVDCAVVDSSGKKSLDERVLKALRTVDISLGELWTGLPDELFLVAYLDGDCVMEMQGLDGLLQAYIAEPEGSDELEPT